MALNTAEQGNISSVLLTSVIGTGQSATAPRGKQVHQSEETGDSRRASPVNRGRSWIRLKSPAARSRARGGVVHATLGGTLLLLALNTAAAAPSATSDRSLLQEARAELPLWAQNNDPEHVRSTAARFDVDQLRSIAETAPFASTKQSFELGLFGDAVHSVEVRKIDRSGPGRFLIYGIIQGPSGDSSGNTIISVVDGIARATVTAPDGRLFEITHAGELYQISQLDPLRMRDCDRKANHQVTAQARASTSSFDSTPGPIGSTVSESSAAATATPVIDVMIVYTPAMLAKAGSVRAMEATCQMAVGVADQAFTDSGIDARVRLVHTQLIKYVESGDSLRDTDRLTNQSDGYMDEVARLRDQHGADVVHLFVSEFTDGYGGRAHYAVDRDGVRPELAYGVCLGSQVTHAFPHELGHNLGCAHDRATAGTDARQAFSYSYGYSFTGSDGVVYRDIMSNVGQPSQRFSNPDIRFKGAATGASKSSSTGADNATTINSTAPIVANFREQSLQNTPKYFLSLPSGGVTFPVTQIGGSGASQEAFIQNFGSAPLEISDCGFRSGGADFRLRVFLSSALPSGGGGWPSLSNTTAFVIEPGGYAKLELNYVPTKYGEANGVLSFQTNDPRLRGGAQMLPMTGAAGPRLKNISTRLQVGTGDNALIGGLIVGGSAPRKVMIRAVGPSLTSSGIAGALGDPVLEVYRDGMLIASNDDWGSGLSRELIQKSRLAPSNDLESAVVTTLEPGSYTTILRGGQNSTGVALVEAYVLDAAGSSELVNISTRGNVGRGDNVMIAGFIVGNDADTRVMIRAIGPSLASSGISRPLQNPVLEVYGSDGARLASNDNWRAAQEQDIVATGLAPTDDREASIIASLPPGSYTAIVRGTNNTSGVALVEVYKLPAENE